MCPTALETKALKALTRYGFGFDPVQFLWQDKNRNILNKECYTAEVVDLTSDVVEWIDYV